MIRLRAAKNIAVARLGHRQSLEDAAREIEVIEPETVEAVPPLYVLPGMFDRVTAGVPGHSTAETELAAMSAPEFVHAPVTRYVLEDCLVHRGGVEYVGGSLAKSGSLRDRFPASAIRTHHRATYCMSRVSHVYFGHWLTDACATALFCADPAEAIIDHRPDWPDTKHYLVAFGLEQPMPGAVRVARLEVYSDHAQGMSKRTRYATMKARLRDVFGKGQSTAKAVYLRRGQTGADRTIANEQILCDGLAARGFDILDLATVDFIERFHRLAAADVVVSVEGSHANHAFFAMRPGAALISLIPSDRFTSVQYGITHAFGLAYGCVVMTKSDRGYIADIDEVLKTINMAVG